MKSIKRWYIRCPSCGYSNAIARNKWYHGKCLSCNRKIVETNKENFKNKLKEMLK